LLGISEGMLTTWDSVYYQLHVDDYFATPFGAVTSLPSHKVQHSSDCVLICSYRSWCLIYSCRNPAKIITRIIDTRSNIPETMNWKK